MAFKNVKFPTLLALGIITFSTTSCKKEIKQPVKPVEIHFKKEGELTIYKSTSDTIIKTLDIEIADTDYDIQTGLMYRNNMLENRGMLFVFTDLRERYFYMKNTRIGLDLIYIDDKFNIVSFQENAKPFDETSLPSNFPAQYVLEVNAGLVKAWNAEVGDSIKFTSL